MSAESVAVCLPGLLRSASPGGGQSIRRHLIDPLGANVLLALSLLPSDGCKDEESCVVAERFQHLQPIAATELAPARSIEWLVRTLEALPHWPAILAAHNSTGPRSVRCRRKSKWEPDESPYRCSGIYMGNSIFSPVLGSPRLSVLRQQLDISRCLSLIHRHEQQLGRNYTRVVHSRMEFQWLAPHPPLSMLDPESVWVPRGEDWSGLNDRHAVLSRAAAEVYMNKWQMIMDGSVMKLVRELSQGMMPRAFNSEMLLARILRSKRVRVSRFPPVAVLGCCNSSSARRSRAKEQQILVHNGANQSQRSLKSLGCFASSCARTSLLSREAVADALAERRAGRIPHPPGTIVMGKYQTELDAAVPHALALNVPGAKYARGFILKERMDCRIPGDARQRPHLGGEAAQALRFQFHLDCIAIVLPISRDEFFHLAEDLGQNGSLRDYGLNMGSHIVGVDE